MSSTSGISFSDEPGMMLEARAKELGLLFHRDETGRVYTVIKRSDSEQAAIDSIKEFAVSHDWAIASTGEADSLSDKKVLSVAELPSASPCRYVVGRALGVYPTDQDTYIREFADGVNVALERMKVGSIERRSPPQFALISEELAGIRHSMAERSRTEHSEDFGIRRQTLIHTPLSVSEAYKKYAKGIASRISENLSTLKVGTPVSIRYSTCDGKQCLMKLEMYEETPISYERCREINKDLKFIPPPGRLRNRETQDNWRDKFIDELDSEKHLLIKNKYPADYLKLIDMEALEGFAGFLENNCGMASLGKTFVIATWQLGLGEGPLIELSKFITLKPKRGEPVPPLNLVHMDSREMNRVIAFAQESFLRVLCWDGGDIRQLKKDVAEVMYLVSHATPWKRGTAAILEMIEDACFRYHGFILERKTGKNVNLEALTKDMESFVRSYQGDELVQVRSVTGGDLS